ncbi:MAG: DUF6049 family protein, partial [Acidimicrobiales bacterium]
RFFTHVIYVPAPPESGRLRFSWVVPVEAPPAIQPDGTSQLDAGASDRLGALATALAAHPGIVAELLPAPETLAGLAASPRAADRAAATIFTTLAAARPPLPTTFVPADLNALETDNLDAEIRSLLDEGQPALGRAADPRVWIATGDLDGSTLGRLRGRGVEKVVVPEAALGPPSPPAQPTLAQPFELQDGPSPNLPAAAADPGLAAHFRPQADPVLAAQRLLADLAVVYFDRPGRPGGLVAVPEAGWRPNARFLEAFLGGLSASPLVASVGLDTFFATVAPASAGNRPLVRHLLPTDGRPHPDPAGVRQARRLVNAYASLAGADSVPATAFRRRLLVAHSSRLDFATRSRYVREVGAAIEREVRQIQIPVDRSITLTAREGEIPVTILSDVPYPLRVTVRIHSDRLEFPDGTVRDINLTRRNTIEHFTVRARSSGSFALRVRVESPDGALALGETLFIVRSTAASGVGVALSGGAALFLAVWWARHFRNRRSRSLVPA